MSENAYKPTYFHTPIRYGGVATLIQAPYAASLDDVDIALIGVPFDAGVTNRAGTRHGPREIRNNSQLIRRCNQATRVAPFETCRVADVGDVWVERPHDIAEAHVRIQRAFSTFVEAGIVPIAFGGDHSISLPILRAIAKNGPVGLIHFDAHADTADVVMGSRDTHASPFRHAVVEGLIDPRRTIQMGIRGTVNKLDAWDYSRETGMRVVEMDECIDLGPARLAELAREVVGDGPTYLTFDIDSLDPSVAPGTGTPEIGGFSIREALRIIRGLTGVNLVGADVVEVSPPFDVASATSYVAASMGFEILCIASQSSFARKAISKREA